jgi:predicted ArsR family transcriptional regulator
MTAIGAPSIGAPSQVRLDARQIRVLAHPLRAKLLGRLRVDGPATATRLADALGTNTGATSYHLRRLAEVGLVAEDDHATRGRERWWRSAHDASSWWRNDFDGDSDATAAADWLNSYAVRNLAEHAEAWNRAAADESAAWRDAAGLSDYLLRLNPAQLRALTEDLHAVIERHRQAAAAADAPDARQVSVYLYGVPRVDPS